LFKCKKVKQTRCGAIEKICLKNFKCHSSLEFEISPFINFILGRNGSGKSAIMDAIILCLGGKASATGRLASAKTFIKNNQEKAELSLTLFNDGDNAYKPSDYGRRIIIERKIGKESSTYRILNEYRKEVSKKKVEVDNIVDHFGIQIENAVCFLTQETSKHFLNSTKKKDRYKLFMKASQIDQLLRSIEEIDQERILSNKLIDEKGHQLAALEVELFKWEDKYKKCQSVEKLRINLGILMQEFSWAMAISFEKKVEALKRDLAVIVKKKEKPLEKIEELQNNLNNFNERYKEIQTQVKEVTSQTAAKTEAYKSINIEFKKSVEYLKQIKNDIRKAELTKAESEKGIKGYRQKIEEDNRSTQIDHDGEKRAKEEKIMQCNERMKSLIELEKARNQEIEMYHNDIEHARSKTVELSSQLRANSTSIQSKFNFFLFRFKLAYHLISTNKFSSR
jgi:structural maintenance of chromosomes protein 6